MITHHWVLQDPCLASFRAQNGLMNIYSILCIILIVQCVALGFIYYTQSESCSKDRIINFLKGFSVELIITVCALQTLLNLSSQNPYEVRVWFYPHFIDERLSYREIKVKSIH